MAHRPTRTALGLASAALLALAGLPGCNNGGGDGSGAGGPEILFITNSDADWWTAVEKGMTDGAKEFNARVEMRRNSQETQGQVEKLREAASLPNVKAVAVSAHTADAPGIISAMRELEKAGKIVITIDSDVADEHQSARRAYIGTNNADAGEVAGRVAADVRPQGGKVVTFVGTASAANAIARKEGFFRGAGSKFSDLEVLEDNSNHSQAGTNVQNALSKYPDLDMLLGLWSYNGPAIARQVEKIPAGSKRPSVVTFDLDEAAVEHLAAGDIDVTVCQNPYEIGYQAVKLLKAMIDGDDATVAEVLPDGKIRETGVRVIVPTGDSPVMKANQALPEAEREEVLTIEEMKSWLASKGLKSS